MGLFSKFRLRLPVELSAKPDEEFSAKAEALTQAQVSEASKPCPPPAVPPATGQLTGDKDADWFFLHYPSLFETYPNEWVAIHRQRVVAHAATVEDFLRVRTAAGMVYPQAVPLVVRVDESFADLSAWYLEKVRPKNKL